MTPSAQGTAYGWRARIGVLQPSLVADNNPYEFYLMAPQGVQLVLTSLGMVERSRRAPDAAERALDHIEEPVGRLLSRGVDVLVQAGIPLVTRHGRGYEPLIRDRVARVTDVPLALDIRCSIQAMQALGLTRIAIVGTFDLPLQEEMAEYLRPDGIETLAFYTLQGAGGEDQGRVPLSVPLRETLAFMSRVEGADGIWLPGASLPVAGIIKTLERETGTAVVTSAQAMLWRALQLAGVATNGITGFGRLFGYQ